VRAPSLAGVFGRPVPLSDGSTTIADARYIRDSILMPRSQVVAGFQPIMPSFAGRIPEEDLIALIAYIQSLTDSGEALR
jgi:cytochrome c oxidase subunit 2